MTMWKQRMIGWSVAFVFGLVSASGAAAAEADVSAATEPAAPAVDAGPASSSLEPPAVSPVATPAAPVTPAEIVREPSGAPIGRVLSVSGAATLVHGDPAQRIPLHRGTRVYARDRLETAAGSRVRVKLSDESILDMGARTALVLSQVRGSNEPTAVRLFAGRLWARVTRALGVTHSFEVETPSLVAGVRGTEFAVLLRPTGEADVLVASGAVAVRTPSAMSEELVEAGEMSRRQENGPIAVSAWTEAQIAEARDSTRPQPALSAAELEVLSERAGIDLRRDAPRLRVGEDNVAPPLDDEPGVGEALLRGEIGIRDD